MDANDEVRSHLKFISLIQPGEKVSTKGMYMQPEGLFTKLSRRLLTHDSRETTMAFVTNAIRKGFELLYFHSLESRPEQKQFDRIMFQNLLQDLTSAKSGLANLKTTYETDRMFCCKIDTLIQEVDAKLKEYDKAPCEKKAK